MLNDKSISTSIVVWCLLPAIMYLGNSAWASNRLDILLSDFAPIDGYVIDASGDEFIIDLDTTKGVKPGDLFCVLGTGEAIVHPVTQKSIGRHETVKNVLRATRIRQGYSYARVTSNTPAIKRGDPIRRYSGLQTRFWDSTGQGKALWKILQRRLPDLIWMDYIVVEKGGGRELKPSASNPAALHFVMTNDKIQVFDSDLLLLKEYCLTLKAADAVDPGGPGYNLSRPGVSDSNPPAAAVKPPAPAIERRPIPEPFSHSPIGTFKGSTRMADFIQLGEQIFMATTDGAGITIFDVSKKLQLLTQKKMALSEQVLALKWWHPSNSAIPYLVVVGWRDNRLASTVFTYQQYQLEPVSTRRRAILSAFDIDGDRRPETLLSQPYDPDGFFGHRIRKLAWDGKTLKSESLLQPLPFNFTVTGSRFADLTRDQQVESIYIRSGVLNISSGKKPLYTLGKQMGGTLSVLTYEKDASFKDYLSASVYFEVAPVAADIDHDGQLELIAVTSDRPRLTVPGLSHAGKNVTLVAFKHQGDGFVKQVLSQPMDTPVQGLGVHNNRILYLVSEPAANAKGTGSSQLFELK